MSARESNQVHGFLVQLSLLSSFYSKYPNRTGIVILDDYSGKHNEDLGYENFRVYSTQLIPGKVFYWKWNSKWGDVTNHGQ